MLREIIWSQRAAREKIEILEYWINRNKSNNYSIRLDDSFQEVLQLISISPEIGISTNEPLVRIKIVIDYQVYYRVKPDKIEVLAIWDTRRNPKKFKL